MGISKLQPQNNGTDWSKYKPIVYKGTSGTLSTTLATILNIAGEGYIDIAFCMGGSFSRIKITVDSTVIHDSRCDSGVGGGIVCNDSIDYTSANYYVLHYGNSLFSPSTVNTVYPYVAGSDTVISIVPQKIFFKSSLKVEVGLISTDGSGTTDYNIRGGIKA
jgi:hypothetical protein